MCVYISENWDVGLARKTQEDLSWAKEDAETSLVAKRDVAVAALLLIQEQTKE
jgi:hypothetical protein